MGAVISSARTHALSSGFIENMLHKNGVQHNPLLTQAAWNPGYSGQVCVLFNPIYPGASPCRDHVLTRGEASQVQIIGLSITHS
jgi:hypothetical protein